MYREMYIQFEVACKLWMPKVNKNLQYCIYTQKFEEYEIVVEFCRKSLSAEF